MYIIWRQEDHAITRDPTTNKRKFARPFTWSYWRVMEHGILNCERGPINKSQISLRGQLPGSHFAISRATNIIVLRFSSAWKNWRVLGSYSTRTYLALASRSPRATSRNLVLQAKFAYIKSVCGNYRKLFFLLCSWFLLNSGEAVYDQSGELVCTKPFPCMPIYFWNDPQGLKYKKAYFNKFVGELQNSIYCTSVLT